MKFPERWTLLRANPPTVDPSTGNSVPTAPTPVAWWGLLQERLIATQQNEILPGVVQSQLELLLKPGLPGGTSRRDVWRFDGPANVADIVPVGGTVSVRGTPRVRRPATGSRRPAYIAAIVEHSSDMEG
jgi:hypothetical protein